MRWTLHPAADPAAVPLDALTAVYHAGSGETHLLAPRATAILAALSEAAPSAGAIDQDALAEHLDLPPEAVAGHLLDLLDAGLAVAA